MASKGINFKNLPKVKKAYLFVIISFFVFALGFGIKAAYAYYNDTSSVSIFANLIGDFDLGDGDINMMFYKESDDGLFYRSYAIPEVGYKFDDSLTKCTIECSTDDTSDCHYSYNSAANEFSLTSNQKVTCKFHFVQEGATDIVVYTMKEDVAGTYTYNSKTYNLIESIPAYGFSYAGYTCDEAATVNFDAETKRFNVQTATKNTCYAYFDFDGNADITVNVYVQSEVGSTVYNRVESIPANNVYELSTTKTSYCYDANGVSTGVTPTYADGYINIDAASQQKCDVYLDLSTE